MTAIEQRNVRIFWIRWIVAILVLILLALAFSVVWHPEETLEVEAGTRLLQFLFVGFLGALVAFLIDSLKERREQSERHREFAVKEVRELLQALDETYRAVKRERRHLRLKTGYDVDQPIASTDYLSAMASIDELELQFEALRLTAEVLQDQIGGSGVKRSIKKMDAYLGTLQTEVERMAVTLGESDMVDPTTPELACFREFVQSRHDLGEANSRYYTEFVLPSRAIRTALVSALAKAQLRDFQPDEDAVAVALD